MDKNIDNLNTNELITAVKVELKDFNNALKVLKGNVKRVNNLNRKPTSERV